MGCLLFVLPDIPLTETPETENYLERFNFFCQQNFHFSPSAFNLFHSNEY